MFYNSSESVFCNNIMNAIQRRVLEWTIRNTERNWCKTCIGISSLFGATLCFPHKTFVLKNVYRTVEIRNYFRHFSNIDLNVCILCPIQEFYTHKRCHQLWVYCHKFCMHFGCSSEGSWLCHWLLWCRTSKR